MKWNYFLDGDKFTIKDENNDYIASTYSIRGDDGGYAEERNAKLLTAAPEMLEALEAIVARMNGDWDNPALKSYGPLSDSESDDIEGFAKAAIQSAKYYH